MRGSRSELAPGVVLVTGPNGAGKTNLLEALHVGTQGFSPRTRNDAQLIRFGAEAARVRVGGESGGASFQAELALGIREPKRARLNGAPLGSAEQLRHELKTLVFTPDRLGVVKGAPATRRAYLDRSLGRLLPARAGLPVEYGSAVGQRNAALRRLAAGVSTRDALDPWTEAVASLGEALVEARREAVVAAGTRVRGDRGPARRSRLRRSPTTPRRPRPQSTRRGSRVTSSVA